MVDIKSNELKNPDIILSSTISYIQNPVVNCRIEKKGKNFLFNPDLDKKNPINDTGIIIWNYLSEPHTINEISFYLLTIFDECPSEKEIIADISTFILKISDDFLLEVKFV